MAQKVALVWAVVGGIQRQLHSLRTANPVDPFDLRNLIRALWLVLEPIQKADTALWEMEEHKLTLANYGLTSEWLSEGYDYGYRHCNITL